LVSGQAYPVNCFKPYTGAGFTGAITTVKPTKTIYDGGSVIATRPPDAPWGVAAYPNYQFLGCIDNGNALITTITSLITAGSETTPDMTVEKCLQRCNTFIPITNDPTVFAALSSGK
jgi:hypothetical protein